MLERQLAALSPYLQPQPPRAQPSAATAAIAADADDLACALVTLSRWAQRAAAAAPAVPPPPQAPPAWAAGLPLPPLPAAPAPAWLTATEWPSLVRELQVQLVTQPLGGPAPPHAAGARQPSGSDQGSKDVDARVAAAAVAVGPELLLAGPGSRAQTAAAAAAPLLRALQVRAQTPPARAGLVMPRRLRCRPCVLTRARRHLGPGRRARGLVQQAPAPGPCSSFLLLLLAPPSAGSCAGPVLLRR